MEFKIGSIILWKNIRWWSSWIQRTALHSPYSHSSTLASQTENYLVDFGANAPFVGFTSFKLKSKNQMEIYELNLPEEILKRNFELFVKFFNKKLYGYLQWIAILIRRIFELLLFWNKSLKNSIRGWHLPGIFSIGYSCAKMDWYWLMINFSEIFPELMEYNPNTFHNGDLKNIIENHPELFKRVY